MKFTNMGGESYGQFQKPLLIKNKEVNTSKKQLKELHIT